MSKKPTLKSVNSDDVDDLIKKYLNLQNIDPINMIRMCLKLATISISLNDTKLMDVLKRAQSIDEKAYCQCLLALDLIQKIEKMVHK